MSRETTQDGDRSSILFIKHSWIPTSTPGVTIANLVTVPLPPSPQFSPTPTTHNGELRDRQLAWHSRTSSKCGYWVVRAGSWHKVNKWVTCSTDAFALAGSSLAPVARCLLVAGRWLPAPSPDQGWSCATPARGRRLAPTRCRAACVVSQPSQAAARPRVIPSPNFPVQPPQIPAAPLAPPFFVNTLPRHHCTTCLDRLHPSPIPIIPTAVPPSDRNRKRRNHVF